MEERREAGVGKERGLRRGGRQGWLCGCVHEPKVNMKEVFLNERKYRQQLEEVASCFMLWYSTPNTRATFEEDKPCISWQLYVWAS